MSDLIDLADGLKASGKWSDVLSKKKTAQEWIPVSERLPEDESVVIITILDETGDTPFRDTNIAFFFTVDGKEIWLSDGELRRDVLAWMPLPEPFDGM